MPCSQIQLALGANQQKNEVEIQLLKQSNQPSAKEAQLAKENENLLSEIQQLKIQISKMENAQVHWKHSHSSLGAGGRSVPAHYPRADEYTSSPCIQEQVWMKKPFFYHR